MGVIYVPGASQEKMEPICFFLLMYAPIATISALSIALLFVPRRKCFSPVT